MALRKKVLNFNKIIKTYKMKVNQKGMDALYRHRWTGSQITYLEVGNDLFTNWK